MQDEYRTNRDLLAEPERLHEQVAQSKSILGCHQVPPSPCWSTPSEPPSVMGASG